MTKDQAQAALIKLGVSESAAKDVLEVLGFHFEPVEVKLIVQETLTITVKSVHSHWGQSWHFLIDTKRKAA